VTHRQRQTDQTLLCRETQKVKHVGVPFATCTAVHGPAQVDPLVLVEVDA
jgi:hypothetical protein